jgi:tetratricopeptide (TPR) repeat protein
MAYANAIRNGFVLDDIPIVVENPVVQSMGNVGTIFTTNYWSRGGTEMLGDPTLYRPLTVLTYAIDYAMWGGANARGFHATNVLLHAATTALVFIVGLSVLGGSAAALAAAAIFAVQPIHTEAVTGVIGRAEILATLFVLLAFSVLRTPPADRTRGSGDDGSPWGRAALGAVLYLLGLFSKETAVTLPALLAVDDWLRRDRLPNDRSARLTYLAARYGALLVAAAVYFAMRQQAISGTARIWPGFDGVSAGQRILTASRVLMEYLALFLFPRTLQADYWKADVPIATSLGNPLVILSVALWVLIGALVVRARHRERALVVSIAWFFITIAPVSNIFFPIGVAKAERVLYLPSVGLCLVAGWALAWVAARARSPWIHRVALGAIVVALGARTVVRNRDWRDNYTLATAALEVSPSSPLMSDIAAGELVKAGDTNRALGLLQEAVRQAPDMPYIRTHLGLVYFSQGRYDQAIAELEESVRRNPTEAEAHNNLGVVYARVGRLDQAAASYREAIRLKPTYETARQNLARLNAAGAAGAPKPESR